MLDDVVEQRQFGIVVGRTHQGVAQEQPQVWPHLEQVGAGVGRAAALILLQVNVDGVVSEFGSQSTPSLGCNCTVAPMFGL